MDIIFSTLFSIFIIYGIVHFFTMITSKSEKASNKNIGHTATEYFSRVPIFESVEKIRIYCHDLRRNESVVFEYNVSPNFHNDDGSYRYIVDSCIMSNSQIRKDTFSLLDSNGFPIPTNTYIKMNVDYFDEAELAEVIV